MNCFPWLILMFNINQSKAIISSTHFSAILNFHVPLRSLLMSLTISHKLNTLACYLGYVCMNRYTVQLQSIRTYELSTLLVQQAEIKYIYNENLQLQIPTHLWLLLACIHHRLFKKTFKLQRSILNILQFSSLYMPHTYSSAQVWSWDMITILILIFQML